MTESTPAVEKFGTRVRDRRLSLQLSQETVAKLANMNSSNYGKLERGLGNPEFHTLVRLAHVLNVDAGKLVEGIKADALPDKPRVFTAQEFLRERSKRPAEH